MSISQATRADVRLAYDYACGYCGVSESQFGGELEIDHFCPPGHGGTDGIDNLVYACTTCNRFKSDYWPEQGDPESFMLLHPHRDDFSTHVSITVDGRAVGLTPRGWFHIRWLHLNRPQLILLRRQLEVQQSLREALIQAETAQDYLRRRIADLESELTELRMIIARLTS